jgi:hypothetical protein
MSEHYRLDQSDTFTIADYNRTREFSSFLPGIAGLEGIPMWAFYVNRGQGIASFGIRDKNNAVLEFEPANKAYQSVFRTGFRTFLKVVDGSGEALHEPFSMDSAGQDTTQTMKVNEYGFEIEDVNRTKGLAATVSYFILPEEEFAGLVRQVKIKNLSGEKKTMVLADGLPRVFPYGLSDTQIKEMSQTMAAFMEVTNLEQAVPFYKLRMTAADSAVVEEVKAGYFSMGFCLKADGVRPLKPIVDPEVLFGANTSLHRPDGLINNSYDRLCEQRQIAFNRLPCCFFTDAEVLEPGAEYELYSVYGFASGMEQINALSPRIRDRAYMEQKQRQSRKIIDALTRKMETHTASELFDAYCRQTYLDNVLRGGYPLTYAVEDRTAVYHVYSRKHGDLERDYNFFSLAPEFYSQGNGNYRDVNQNRRNDGFFDPRVGDYNIRTFMNLLQADGYNPLVLKGSSFRLPETHLDRISGLAGDKARLKAFFSHSYTPGGLVRFLKENNITINTSTDEFLEAALTHSEQISEAEHGEGYWADHWTYNLDLVDTFLAVYPDQRDRLFFEDISYTYFDNEYVVLPRNRKYVLSNGQVRQYHAVERDPEKKERIQQRASHKNQMRDRNGEGEIYRSSLFAKFLCLIVNKAACLDPYGMGVEMEAEKPGWYDALNGLPGLLGSSMAETFELKRHVDYLAELATAEKNRNVKIPEEVHELMGCIANCFVRYQQSADPDRDYICWDETATAREAYRASVKFGFSGREREVKMSAVVDCLNKYSEKLEAGIRKALCPKDGLYPTFFYYEVKEYEVLEETFNSAGNPCVRPLKFEQVVLPYFLEGVVKSLKLLPSAGEAREMYGRVKMSELYDRKLRMYKVNAPLTGLTFELGRTKAFVPGWLENESVFLHMEYKYLLECLRAGLYEEFYEDVRTALIPFLDPETYGRSILENSSFLASSANPDETVHGRGFVARLSGASAEFLSMWNGILAGRNPFLLKEGKLCLELKPALPGWLFREDGTVSFLFLGQCSVAYHNPQRLDTWSEGAEIQKMILTGTDGQVTELSGGQIPEPYSALVRDGKIERIDAFLGLKTEGAGRSL